MYIFIEYVLRFKIPVSVSKFEASLVKKTKNKAGIASLKISRQNKID